MSFMGDGSGDFPDEAVVEDAPEERPFRRARGLPGPLGKLQAGWRRMRRKQRRIAMAAAGGFVAVLLLLIFVCGRSGGGGEEDFPELEFEDEPSEQLPPAGERVAAQGSGEGGEFLPQDVEQVVSQRVEATVTALRLEMVTPTPQPSPTIDVSSTLEARISGPFSGSPDSTLRRHELRSPYLSPLEVRFLERTGPDIWLASLSYVVLQEVLSQDRASYTQAYLTGRSDSMRSYVFRFSLGDSYSSEELNPLVLQFVTEVRGNFTLMAQASARLDRLADLYEGVDAAGTLPAESDGDSRRLVQELSVFSDQFHDFMSRYGCSICGELYRSDPSIQR